MLSFFWMNVVQGLTSTPTACIKIYHGATEERWTASLSLCFQRNRWYVKCEPDHSQWHEIESSSRHLVVQMRFIQQISQTLSQILCKNHRTPSDGDQHVWTWENDTRVANAHESTKLKNCSHHEEEQQSSWRIILQMLWGILVVAN